MGIPDWSEDNPHGGLSMDIGRFLLVGSEDSLEEAAPMEIRN